MELKPYQQQVLDSIGEYFDYLNRTDDIAEAFNQFWQDKYGPDILLKGTGLEPYKNNIPKVPHLCVKVPTAGGKTFIAANAIDTIFKNLGKDKLRSVIWLVPGITILEQTYKALSDNRHPYRQKLNAHFGSNVQVYRKEDLLQGASFDPISVREQLSVFVLSFDSLRTKNKEGRKFYQENGALASFAQSQLDRVNILEGTDETALINVIRQMHPVVVVDESHNAESALSVEMLRNLNPSFMLDLTATPRKHSNIISFVDALALKQENMVKLPVIVSNHTDRNGVIENAINLQRKLEAAAKAEEAQGGKYIRPIVLFQAQPKTSEDNTTFEKIKDILLELQIPEDQIKIKTANKNEIKDIDLMSRECPVRYIITVNALREGWDCPFAYILASLADKSSAVDVEQILGRILRQPHVMKHDMPLLNTSFVLTASSKFMATLDSIVAGLNKAGFSARDYKVAEVEQVESSTPGAGASQFSLTEFFDQTRFASAASGDAEADISKEVDTGRIRLAPVDAQADTDAIARIAAQALQANQEMDQQVEAAKEDGIAPVPEVIKQHVKTYPIKEVFQQAAKDIRLPQFTMDVPLNPLFSTGTDNENILLHKDMLLQNFKLSQANSEIEFDAMDAEIYEVDVVKTGDGNSRPEFKKVAEAFREPLREYIVAQPQEVQRTRMTERMMQLLGSLYPLPDAEVKAYLRRVFQDFDSERVADYMSREVTYKNKIREKINLLAEEHAEKQFQNLLDTDTIGVKDSFKFKSHISPVRFASAITKSLYEQEADMNVFEQEVINDLANLSNVAFWHRNLERSGFYLNGFINHYPDFVVVTKSGKVLVVETKGDHLDNEDSRKKLTLGKAWAGKAGHKYKYFMVFNTNPIPGAHRHDEFIRLVSGL